MLAVHFAFESLKIRSRMAEGKRQCHRSLVVQNGEIGVMKEGEFQGYTNFTMEVVHAVKSPSVCTRFPALYGFVYSIKSTDDVIR